MSNSYRSVCVVGGGPAGLASAIALRREGCGVTVVDCAAPPIDKACGEGLMPDGIQALNELGIAIPAGAGFPFRGIRFSDGRSPVSADFPDGVARGIRRPVLHNLFIERATKLNIPIIWNARHVRLTADGISFDDRRIPADLVVGADGQNSQIRRQAGLSEVRCEKRRYGFRRHFRVAPWSPYMELHWGATSQIYVTPTAPDEVCVATISPDPHLRLNQTMRHFPELSSRLRDAAPVTQEAGALSVSRSLQRVQRNNVVLVGDASGSVDAITGEGICLAVKQACALALAVRSGQIQKYERLHRALMKRPQTMALLLLSLARNGPLQRRALAGLAQRPEIFESLLAIHVGAAPFRQLCTWRLFDFGWAFLAP